MATRNRILELAEYLGWPQGIKLTVTDETIPGGEAGWRAWVGEDEVLGGDEDDEAEALLEWAVIAVVGGLDPGPPETWNSQYREKLERDWPADDPACAPPLDIWAKDDAEIKAALTKPSDKH